MKNSFLTKPNYIRIYGHRGARGDIVENSLEGFKYTFDLGIKAIEFDVVVTKDNIPILFHDYRLNKDMVKDSNGNWLDKPDLKIIDQKGTNVYDLLKYKNVVFTTSSLKSLQERLAKWKNLIF